MIRDANQSGFSDFGSDTTRQMSAVRREQFSERFPKKTSMTFRSTPSTVKQNRPYNTDGVHDKNPSFAADISIQAL